MLSARMDLIKKLFTNYCSRILLHKTGVLNKMIKKKFEVQSISHRNAAERHQYRNVSEKKSDMQYKKCKICFCKPRASTAFARDLETCASISCAFFV